MTVSTTDLAEYVGAADPEDTYIQQVLDRASALVTAYIGQADVPEVIVDGATLETASELYHRRNAPNGVAQFASDDGGQPIFTARDPMIRAYPLLDRYVIRGLA